MSRLSLLEKPEKIFDTLKSLNNFKENAMYATIKENLSVIINGKLDYWPPARVENIYIPWERTKARRRYLNAVFKVTSGLRQRRRVELNGQVEHPEGKFVKVKVLAWLSDLEFCYEEKTGA